MTWPVRHLSVSIDRPPAAVAAFVGDPANLPLWAAGLSAGIRHEDERWLTSSPMGDVEVRFTGPVDLGILDHDVVLPDGVVVHNPLRVLANDAGSEVVFTLYRLEGVSDDDYDRDSAMVADDLARLRDVLQG
ncbi:SRPBCC family protein [Propionibacteriaceae bacterium G1746]|uniref:SRPBCC family protein n=1 Tax=Aestuariimicrobium sp. G57 TaxID=3418485 RepID=UPI003C22E2E3